MDDLRARSAPRRRPSAPARVTPALILLFTLAALSGCDSGARSGRTAPADAAAPATLAITKAAPTPEVPADAPLVTFLGDSLSAGLHLARDEAFPAVLQRNLTAAGHAFRLVNAGVSGSTTAQGLSRTDWILDQGPDLVVIQLGANDGFRGIPLDTVKTNLLAIIEKVRDAGAQPLLLAIQLPPNYGKEYVAGFNELFPNVAREAGVPLVLSFMEGVGGRPEMNLPDGIHPTPEGHMRLAQNLEAALIAALEKLPLEDAVSF